SSLIDLVTDIDPPTPLINTLSLHDALPISSRWQGRLVRSQEGPRGPRSPACRVDPERHLPWRCRGCRQHLGSNQRPRCADRRVGDRKSTRLNSSHVEISYAVFCLKKKKKEK